MEPHARHPKTSFDPVIDTPEFRRSQRDRLQAFVAAHVAVHGPLDARKLAELDATFDDVEARLAEAELEA